MRPASTASYPFDPHCSGVQSNGFYWNVEVFVLLAAHFGVGDVLRFAADLDAHTLEVYKNATQIAAIPRSRQALSIRLPAVTRQGNQTLTANFGASTFVYSPTQWLPTQAGTYERLLHPQRNRAARDGAANPRGVPEHQFPGRFRSTRGYEIDPDQSVPETPGRARMEPSRRVHRRSSGSWSPRLRARRLTATRTPQNRMTRAVLGLQLAKVPSIRWTWRTTLGPM